MTGELVVQQALNGISFGALLFVLAAGLSLIFGMMDVLNLAHGAFYMLGAYLALAIVRATGNFWLALVVVPVALGLLGRVLEPLLLRRIRGLHLQQALLTIGVALVITDLIRIVFGGELRTLPAPAGLDRSVDVLGNPYPVYRLFVIVFAAALAATLSFVYRRTRLGALIRAGVGDAEMLGALGVDTERLFANTYAVGVGLAALAGVVAAPILTLQPGADEEMLILSLVVVVVGGLGTLGGAIAGSLLIGPADSFGKVFLEQFSLALIFAVMALVLLFRPTGLLGRIRIGR